MNSSDYSLAARNLSLSEGVRYRFPRVLFLPWSANDMGEGPTVMAGGLRSEGWSVATSPEAAKKSGSFAQLLAHLPAGLGPGLIRLRSMIRTIPQYDLVQVSCQSMRQLFREGLLAVVLARFFGKKIVLHFSFAETERVIEERRWWLTPFLKLADCIVVGSRSLQKAFGRVGLEAKILVEACSLDGLEHEVRSKLQPRILVDCALEPDLNVGCAIRAYQLVKQKYPRAELVVVGDGSERSKLESWATVRGFCDVDFRVGISLHERTRLYQECDLFLHTPFVDESPKSLTRAFAAGLPVVVTDADGLLHMVRDGESGMIVAAGDHVGVADRVIELIENQQLTEKLSRQGAVEARKYTWARVRQDWVNLFTDLNV